MSRVEVAKSPETNRNTIEITKKRDIKLVKKALGKTAGSYETKSVKKSIAERKPGENLEIKDQRQLKAVAESLGKLATEKGITKFFRNRRAKRLARHLGYVKGKVQN